MSGRSYVGDIYIGLFNDAGEFTGFLDQIINTTTISFTPPEVERVPRTSFRRSDPGQTLEEYSQTTGSSQMSMTTNEAIPKIMAMALLGNDVEVDITAGSVAAESVTVHHDKWVKLANVNITEGTVSIDTFVEDTDFEVDERKGMIKALSGGGMTDATAYDVAYDHTAITGYEVFGHTKTTVRAKVFGDMEDQATKARGELEVFDVRLRPSDAISFIQDQAFLEATLEGTMISVEQPSGKLAPFRFREIEAA